MSPEDLKTLIERGPSEKLVAELAPLTEAERKKLSASVVAIRKELALRERERNQRSRRSDPNSRTPPKPCPHCGKPLRSPTAQRCYECGKSWQDEGRISLDGWNRESEVRLKFALMAVSPLNEAQRIRVWHVAPRHDRAQFNQDFLFRVLQDRKPDWLPKWVDKELDEDVVLHSWQFVRRLVVAGICPKPQGENYILKMVRGGVYSNDATQSLKDQLLADPGLLDDEVWRLFEVSPVRATIIDSLDISDIPFYKQNDRPSRSWADSFCRLAAEGKLDRSRLLAASLGSLLKNTEARNTTWFSKFHELLAPTPEEREKLQHSYVQLLSHPVPAVVGMALDALSELEKSQRLDVPGFLAEAAAAFRVQPKSQPMAAVKLLGRIAAKQKTNAGPIADALLPGLSHPAPQVQQAIVDVLAKLGDVPAIAEQLPGLIDGLAPSVQGLARSLVKDAAPQTTPAAAAPDRAGDERIDEARRAPTPWREWAGIDGVLQALEGTGELTAVAFDPMRVPRLDPAHRVQPIETLDELIEGLTIAVESPVDAVEFERLLDGMSRLCDQRPDDFAARIAPLVKRIKSGGASAMAIAGRLQMSLLGLIVRWADLSGPASLGNDDSIVGFLESRVRILMARMQRRQAAPLLAFPTHRRGWIDPQEMLRRFRWHEERDLEPSSHDVIQGFLRLAPDGREEALAGARSLQGKFAPAFRYALCGPLEEATLPAAVWIAAGRARSPFAELVDLRSLGDSLGPDAIVPARYSWELVPVDEGTPQASVRLLVKVEPVPPAAESIREMPTVLLHNWRVSEGENRWVGTVWPANPQSFCVAGARLRVRMLSAQILRQRAEFLDPLFDPDEPFTEMARLLVAFALNQAEAEVTGLAVDLLIELIRDGRCVGPELGVVLRPMLKADMLKLNRLAKHLAAAANASLLHAHVCAQIVQTMLAGIGDLPKDMHYLLGPLLEWLTALCQGVRDEIRPLLERTTGGKAGTIAKRLQQLGSSKTGHSHLTEALEGRLQRVRRWASLDGLRDG